MKIKFLGTGTSTGVPEIGCQCEVCLSDDQRDHRLRSSVLIDINGKTILIDCGPDFRQQMLTERFRKIDGVLLSHEHYDHVGGIDDLRPFCRFDDVDIYTNSHTAMELHKRMPYCFSEHKYPGIPNIVLHEVGADKSFRIEDVEVLPINIMHYKLSIYGYRIGNMAYLTDVKQIPESEYDKLKNLDVLVISALRHTEHLSHQTLEDALIQIGKIAPRRSYLIHMSHQIGLHTEVEATLPKNVYLAYDGLEVDIC